MLLTENKIESWDIFDAQGKYHGFDMNEAAALITAANIGGKAIMVMVVDNAYNDEHYSDPDGAAGCPYCGSYEGDSTECPECGHGQ